jgi:hypothetical protein
MKVTTRTTRPKSFLPHMGAKSGFDSHREQNIACLRSMIAAKIVTNFTAIMDRKRAAAIAH